MDPSYQIEEFLKFLQPKLGQEIHVGPWLKIDQQRINQFAEVTGDQQWIHIDSERAEKESPYGSTIAHGYLTLSLLPYLTESNHPDFFQKNYPGMTYRVNYGLDRIRFPAPVKVGTNIRARTTIKSAAEIKGSVQICYLMTIEIEGEAKPACSAEFLARLYP